MTEINPSEAAQKSTLPVWGLVTSCYGLLYYRFKDFVRIMWLPTLLSALSGWRALDQGYGPAMTDAQTGETAAELAALQLEMFKDPMTYIYVVVMWLSLTAAFVAVQRMVLLDENPPRPFGTTLGKRELRYIGYTVAMYVAASLPYLLVFMVVMGFSTLFESGPPAFAGILLFVLALASFIFAIVAYLRFGLVLPAVAVDEARGVKAQLGDAWEMAKGQTFNLFLALFLASLPFAVLSYVGGALLFGGADAGATSTAGGVVFLVFSTITTSMLYFIATAIYARAYQVLSQYPQYLPQDPLAQDV